MGVIKLDQASVDLFRYKLLLTDQLQYAVGGLRK